MRAVANMRSVERKGGRGQGRMSGTKTPWGNRGNMGDRTLEEKGGWGWGKPSLGEKGEMGEYGGKNTWRKEKMPMAGAGEKNG